MKLKSVNQRIKFLIEELNLNNRAFSIKLGVDPTVIHNIVSGRMSTPSYAVLEKILLTFDNINANWLITGKGQRYGQPTEQISILSEASPQYEKSSKEIRLENEIINLKGQIEAYKNVITSLSQNNASSK
jgi:transcriptional regulator with XRE-family HTH domain